MIYYGTLITSANDKDETLVNYYFFLQIVLLLMFGAGFCPLRNE